MVAISVAVICIRRSYSSGFGISRSLAVMMSVSMAISMTVSMSISMVTIASISMVAISVSVISIRRSYSSGFGISRSLAIMMSVSMTVSMVAISSISVVAISSVPVISISCSFSFWFSENNSHAGKSKGDQQFHVWLCE